jgi:MATE family multidrug resistance protein
MDSNGATITSTTLNDRLVSFDVQSSEHSEEQAVPTPLALLNAIQKAAYYSLPPAFARGLVAGKSLISAILAGYLSESAIAGYALGSILQQTMLAITKGAISSVDTVIADLDGKKQQEKIGAAVNQGLVIASVLGISATALFASANVWIEAMGVSPPVAQQAGSYLRALSYGFLPMCWTIVDQNFLFSIKRNSPVVVFSTFLVGASMAIGYPMMIRTKDVAWLGYGVSYAAILAFFMTRMYLYLNKTDGVLDRYRYNLFMATFESGTSFGELLKLSFPTALQGLSEWLPSLLTTFIIASDDSENTAEAQAPSVQLLVALNQILLSMSSSASVLVSNNLGIARLNSMNENLSKIAIKNAKTMGNASVIVTTGLMAPVAALGMFYPDPIVNLFCHSEEAFELSKTMLQITCATLLLDAMRNAITGALLGRKQPVDNFFTSLSNLIITAGLSTVAGFLTQKDLGPLSFFISKMIGIAVTTGILGYYWNIQSKKIESTSLSAWCALSGQSAAHPESSNNLAAHSPELTNVVA